MSNILYPLIVLLVSFYKAIQRTIVRIFQTNIEKLIQSRLKKGGITINGDKPWDIKVHKKDFYSRLACDASLGMGESYMAGDWDCDKLDECIERIFSNELYDDSNANRFINYLLIHVFNLQTSARAFEVGVKHYDLGNDFFESFLDLTMNYSCAYYRETESLDQAQINKMELIAKKLHLKSGMRVLELGCGWGALCKYLAVNYKVHMVGCTVSVEGAKFAQKRCENLSVDIRAVDYREIDEKFDRVVSVGMFEHVGTKNYKTFFEVANRCLVDDGIFLVHTIGTEERACQTVPWMHTYVFPNVILPHFMDIPENSENLFVIEDWHNFGHDYSTTLMAWYDNFVKSWPRNLHRGEQFYRMWKYYLLSAAGAFRSRKLQLWQVVLTKNGLKGGYQAAR